MSTDKRESKLNQVRNLLNKTTENGCTQEEANSAFLMAQSLMASWNIAENEITVEFSNEPETSGWTSVSVTDKNTPWFRRLAHVIAENFRCQDVIYKVEREKKITMRRWNEELGAYVTVTQTIKTTESTQYRTFKFFGAKSDSEVAGYVFEQAVNAARALADAAVEDETFEAWSGMTARKFKLAYLEGFVTGLDHAYREAAKESTALVLYKKMPEHIEAEWNSFFTTGALITTKAHAKSYGKTNSRAYNGGMQDGRQFGSAQKGAKGGKQSTKFLAS